MSWVPSADGSLFPIQNLPYGIFSHAPSGRDPRPGVAIGDMVLDLRAAATEGLMDGLPFAAETVFGGSTLNAFMETPHTSWAAVRARLVALLSKGGEAALRDNKALQARCLVQAAECQMHLPASIGDYARLEPLRIAPLRRNATWWAMSLQATTPTSTRRVSTRPTWGSCSAARTTRCSPTGSTCPSGTTGAPRRSS
jgi:hypothetical protein